MLNPQYSSWVCLGSSLYTMPSFARSACAVQCGSASFVATVHWPVCERADKGRGSVRGARYTYEWFPLPRRFAV